MRILRGRVGGRVVPVGAAQTRSTPAEREDNLGDKVLTGGNKIQIEMETGFAAIELAVAGSASGTPGPVKLLIVETIVPDRLNFRLFGSLPRRVPWNGSAGSRCQPYLQGVNNLAGIQLLIDELPNRGKKAASNHAIGGWRMSIVTVDLVDGDKVAISFDDGTTAVYDERQLMTLEPLEIVHDAPRVGTTIDKPEGAL